MEATMERPSVSTMKVIRWIARVLGILIILFFVAMFFSEDGLSKSYNLHLTQDILPLNWIITMAAYILAWKWERTCGILILVMYIIHGLLDPEALLVPFWILMAIPGFLFLICSMERIKRTASKD